MTDLPSVNNRLESPTIKPLGHAIRRASAPKRILAVGDHALVRDGLRFQVSQHSDMEISGEASDMPTALALVKQSHPDLVVIDTTLKDGNGLDLVARIRAYDPTIKMLVMSMFDELVYAERFLRAGALGYISKKEPRQCVLNAMKAVLQGDRYLSQQMTQRWLELDPANSNPSESPVATLSNRELEVFQLIGSGMSTGTIARKLNLSRNTIESHRANIKSKLGLRNAGELQCKAVQWVLENG